MTNVGSLNATLTLSNEQWTSGLDKSTKDMLRWEQETKASARRANAEISNVGASGGGLGKGTGNALQQMTYGLQDFTSQFDGTVKGLSRGLNGISNNLQTAAQYAPGYWKLILGVGAVALPFVPQMVEMATGLKDTTEELDKQTKALAEWRKQMIDAAKFKEEMVAGGSGGFGSYIKEREDQLKILSKQQQELQRNIRTQQETVADWDNKFREQDNKGGIASWFGTQAMKEGGDAAKIKLEAMSAELHKATEEANKLNRELSAAQRLKPDIEKAESGRDKIEAFRERQEMMAKGREEIEKLERKGLEEYGSEHSKLMAKQLRERTELEDKTRGLREHTMAMGLLADQHAIEQQKLKVSELEQAISKMGQDAKASAGLDMASSEGIRAINRAMGGIGETDAMKRQLVAEKMALADKEQVMSGGELSPVYSFAAKGAGDGIDLGAGLSMGEMNRDGSFVRIGNDGATVSGAFPEATQGKARRQRQYRGPDQSDIWDRVEAAKQSREIGGQQMNEQITRMQAERVRRDEAKGAELWAKFGNSQTQGIEDTDTKLLKRIADKPVMKVVSLSGG